ncbi:hypothetical protein BHE74_00013484 [Ensete ventricosum]|nr:hypothetical protein BHE74_00013484 [Ensete ventricosum]
MVPAVPMQPVDPPSPSEVQEISPEEATRKAPEASSKHPAEASYSPWKKAKINNRLEVIVDALFEFDLSPLTHGSRIWQDGEASAKYVGGTQVPQLAVDLYTLPSEVLMDQAVKTLVLVSPQLTDSESQLWNVRTQVRQMENELLKLTQIMNALWIDLSKQAVEDYKKLLGFEIGLLQMGWVSLQYDYQLALARLRAWHPSLEIEEDPFNLLPEDSNLPMANEQPFDDSQPPPEE